MRDKLFLNFKKQINEFLSRIKEKELTERELEDYLDDLTLLLVQNDVALETAEDIISQVKSKLIGKKIPRFSQLNRLLKEALRETLLEIFNETPKLDFMEIIRKNKTNGKVTTIVFEGINGVGKTLTIAKLAYKLKNMGYKVVLACSDTFRAGAIEQLEQHAKEIGVKMIKRPYGADPASVAYDAIMHAEARGLDVVMIDTAGRMHTNVNLMEELRKIIKVAQPDLRILVVDALTGHDALMQSKQFLEAVGFDGAIVTKVDANAKCGCIISIVHQTRKPILFLGVGSRYEDIEVFNVNSFLTRILGES